MKKLDTVFSIFIRQRDSNNGYITCITCGKSVQWKQADCGHFIKRRHLNTRFNELNCYAQCKECNNSEKDKEFEQILIKRFGQNFVDDLIREKNKTLKLSKTDIIEKIKYYQSKIW